jgi:uncharacterized phage protein gp47/JayE
LAKSIAQLSGKISQQNGFTAQTLNKLGFSTDVVFGINGYSTFTGLIKAASLEVFGDPTSPTSFPGLISPGSYLEIAAPIIKRVVLSLAVRLSTGLSLAAVQSTIQDTVTGQVNKLPIGQGLPFSDIISAVNGISGVTSVIVTFPSYTSTNDGLTVTSLEKLLVITASDISVSQIS